MNKKGKAQESRKGLREKNGIWYVNFQIKGERKEIRVGSDVSKALLVRKKIKLMALEGTLQKYLQQEKSEIVTTYCDAVKDHWENYLRLKKSGKDMYGRLKKSLLFFEIIDIRQIRWQDVEKFRNERLQQVKPATVKQELDLMHAVFDRQVKLGTISKNPVDGVKKPSFNNVREEIISHEDFLELLRTEWIVDNRGSKLIKGIDFHLKLALVIADFTAMRIGEVLNIRWSDIKGNLEYIFVPESKNQKKRQVPIHPELSKILQSLERKCEYVVNFKGEKVCRIKKGFEKIRKEAGMEFLHIHDFRHRAITRWVQESHPVNAIMKATGHSTFSAFNRYSNLKEGDVQILVGRKTEPLPYVTFNEFYGLEHKNVEKMWKVAS